MVKKKKSKKSKKKLWIGIGLVLLLMVIPSLIFYNVLKSFQAPPVGKDDCSVNDIISPYCEGEDSKKVLQKTCIDSGWEKSVVEVCGADEQCAFGKCFSNNCGTLEPPYCITDFERVISFCENGEVSFKREICGSKTSYSEIKGYCLGGECYQQASSCGDGICSNEEDIVSCYRDCSSINDADAFAREVAANIEELAPYLECNADFDCDSFAVIQMADSIMDRYNIPDGNPQMYMDAVIDYTNDYITYHFGGGTTQCGESASDMIERGWGNCVDYSIVSISFFRTKGIPSRQVAGCVSHQGWFCHTFALRDISRLGGVPIAWDSDAQRDAVNEQVVGGSVLGHSWIEVWLGEEKGWVTADPTVGDTISKKCVGYYPVTYGGTGESHKDCEGAFGGGPCYTSAWCHIEGKEALEFCKTY